MAEDKIAVDIIRAVVTASSIFTLRNKSIPENYLAHRLIGILLFLVAILCSLLILELSQHYSLIFEMVYILYLTTYTVYLILGVNSIREFLKFRWIYNKLEHNIQLLGDIRTNIDTIYKNNKHLLTEMNTLCSRINLLMTSVSEYLEEKGK